MSKFLNTKLLASLVFGAVVVSGCSGPAPTRYVGSASKASSNSEEGSGTKKPSKTEDLGDEDEGSDNDTDTSNNEPDTTKPDPMVPDTSMPEPMTEPEPEPMKDPAVEIKAKLEEACTPKSVTIKDQTNGVEGYSVFMSVFTDAEKELKAIALNDCVNMYKTADEVKAVKRSNLTILITVDNHDGVAYANPVPNTSVSNVHISTNHIKNYKNASAANRKQEFYGVMSHEINHLYQNFSNGYTYYSEGLCDAIRADADYYPRSRKTPNAPNKWKGSYTDTGYFLRYLRKAKDKDFYWKFNKKMANWNENFWMETFGMSVDQLWNEYQQKGFDPNDY